MPIRISLRDGSGRGGRRSPRATRIVDSLAAVAEFAGVTVQSVCAWFERGAPVTDDGTYDLFWEIARWHATTSQVECAVVGTSLTDLDTEDHADDGSDDDDLDGIPDVRRSDWTIRRVRAAALTAELKLKEATGAVIPITDHHNAIFAVVDSFVSALENLPPRVTPLLAGARDYQEINTILRDHIRAMRIQLAGEALAGELQRRRRHVRANVGVVAPRGVPPRVPARALECRSSVSDVSPLQAEPTLHSRAAIT